MPDDQFTFHPPLPPEPGFRLFTKGEPWKMNACVNLGMGRLGYLEGYLQAATALITEVEERRGLPDFLIYPIIFLYRQHIELQLKDIVWLLRSLGGYECGVPNTHNVADIWRQLRKPLSEFAAWKKDERDNLDLVDEYMRQIVELDSNSDAFRYHEDKSRNPKLANIEQINLVIFRDRISWLIYWLNRVSSWLYAERDLQREADSE